MPVDKLKKQIWISFLKPQISWHSRGFQKINTGLLYIHNYIYIIIYIYI